MGFYTGGCRKFKSQSFNILPNEKFNQNSTLLLQWFSIKLSSHSPIATAHMRKMAKGVSVHYYNIFWAILFLLNHLFPNITAFWICILVSHLGNVKIFFYSLSSAPPPPLLAIFHTFEAVDVEWGDIWIESVMCCFGWISRYLIFWKTDYNTKRMA